MWIDCGARRQSGARARVAIALCATLLVCATGGGVLAAEPGGGGGPAKDGPAQVDNARPETELATLRLEARAVERLGIVTVAVEKRVEPRTRTVGGVVMTPPGRSLAVAAPSEGTVLTVEGRALPYPGTSVRRGQPLLRLLVVSTAELARAREVAEVAAARLAIAEAAMQGAEPTPAATAELESARASLEGAQARQRLLTGGAGAGAAGLAPVTVTAPSAGVVRSLAVSAGQAVPAGAALLELVPTDPVWVRVPIYAGDLSAIRAEAPARVRRLGAPASLAREAEPVTGPPSANADSASVDLYYRVGNAEVPLRPDERVSVTLVLGESAPSLVFPYSAVLYDIHGGSWVYEEVAPRTYVRRRVDLGFVREGVAVARSGPEEGARIVTDGAAELFGTEFGIGK